MTVDLALMTTLLIAAAAVLAQRPDLAAPTRREDPDETVVLYPVRHEAETTMRQDLAALGDQDGRGRRRRVLAISDHDDPDTIAGLERLRREIPYLDILVAPDPADPMWSTVWRSWLVRTKAWRETRSGRPLPPRQRRQVVYGYHHVEAGGGAVVGGVHARRS